MARLLTLPNDPTSAFYRNSEEDFLSEFNPVFNGERFFEKVYTLNWKDERDEQYFGVQSKCILKDKEKAFDLVVKLGNKEIPFDYPLFTNIFLKEKREIIERARECRPDIMRAFNADHAAELGIILKKELNIPLVISVHNTERVTDAIPEADSLVCISEILKEMCINEYGMNSEKITLIPDGIDMDFFQSKKKSEISKIINPDYTNKILTVGRFTKEKNLENILRAMKIIKEELLDVYHVHLGDDLQERKENIIRLRNELGLENISYFLGGRPKLELPFFYSWADVFVFPSLWEGLGRASIEALACETPVVTSNYAPMTEVVQDSYNGLICDPNIPESIAESVLKVLTQKELREKLIRNSRKSVVNKYNVINVMQAHGENYKKLLI